MVQRPRVFNIHSMDAPRGTVYVGRGTPWGNPFKIGVHGTREEVIARFECEILPKLDLTFLRGKHLKCWCKPLACHADILLREANK